jgi:hypothetical protein
MSAFDFIQSLWIGAQLSAPPFVQRAVIPRLHEAKELVRLLVPPYLPYHQLRGQGQGGPLTVTFVGSEFARPRLETLLFVDKPEEENRGRIPVWRCGEQVGRFSTDMVIVGAARHLVRSLPRQYAIVLPEFVHHTLDVKGDWQDVCNRFHKTIRKNELRWIRKYSYDYVLSHRDQDFHEFYDQMYVPSMNARHGELASPMSIGVAFQYFRHGWLFQVKRQDKWVSGVVCQPQQHLLNARILGVRNADPELIHQGAISAIYYAAIHWANQHGYEAVNFLGTDPYLRLGLFQQKRKWGASLSIPATLHRQIWIGIQRITPAVSQFLKENPFVIEENGKLQGLVIVDDPHQVSAEAGQEWQNLYVTPGLSQLVIRSVRSFSREPASVPSPDLVIPIPSSAGGENR